MTDSIGEPQVQRLVHTAIRQVWAQCPDLVQDDVHERTVVAHIASAINQGIAGLPGSWRADVEYDRIWRHGTGAIRKKLWKFREGDGEDDFRAVIPDLIVHDPRGLTSPRCLLVLEAKKGRVTKKGREHDYVKLCAFRQQLGYQHTVFLEFDGVGGRPRVEWIRSAYKYPDPSVHASEEL
ncbi:hypothetical protein [Nocardia sp. NPDC051833]|uniref:hypothetical protein n=1 Tax=Nocardia sp. NPDC051833 TaxID=3155674 RepID=UPI00342A9242